MKCSLHAKICSKSISINYVLGATMLRKASAFIVAAMFLFLGGSIAQAAAKKTSPYDLYNLSCSKNQRATGCASPYRQCDFGVEQNIIDTCKLSAEHQRCPDFSWEKCCATNCYLRAGKKHKGTQACIDECSEITASRIYWLKDKGKKVSRR
jgi:hypothetical protein